MTIPLIVLLVALGLLFLGGAVMAVVGVLECLKRDDNFGLAFVGVTLAIVAIMAFAGIAYHSDGPACRLAPSSLVERAP